MFFLETQPKDEQFKIEFDGASAESEAYLNHMDGATLELVLFSRVHSNDLR